MSVHIQVQYVEQYFPGFWGIICLHLFCIDTLLFHHFAILQEIAAGCEKVAFCQRHIFPYFYCFVFSRRSRNNGVQAVIELVLSFSLHSGVIDGGSQLPVEGAVVEDSDEFIHVEHSVNTRLRHVFVDPLHHGHELVETQGIHCKRFLEDIRI